MSCFCPRFESHAPFYTTRKFPECNHSTELRFSEPSHHVAFKEGNDMDHSMKHNHDKHAYLSGKRVLPKAITKKSDIAGVIDNMDAYNGGRLRAACQLMRDKYSQKDVTIGLSIAGALTPAGLGPSTIIPLMNHGFVDWLVSTGANMYHDMHFA